MKASPHFICRTNHKKTQFILKMKKISFSVDILNF